MPLPRATTPHRSTVERGGNQPRSGASPTRSSPSQNQQATLQRDENLTQRFFREFPGFTHHGRPLVPAITASLRLSPVSQPAVAAFPDFTKLGRTTAHLVAFGELLRPLGILPCLLPVGIGEPVPGGDISMGENIGVHKHLTIAAARTHSREPPNQGCRSRSRAVAIEGDEPMRAIAPELV